MFHFIHKWKIVNSYSTLIGNSRGAEWHRLSYSLKCIKCGKIYVGQEDYVALATLDLRIDQLLVQYPNPELKRIN